MAAATIMLMSATTPIVDGLAISTARQLARDGGGRRIRELAGLSRRELARMVATSEVNVWRWEETGRQPRGQLAVRYGAALSALLKANGEDAS